MTLADDRLADVDVFFDADTFAETVAYTPSGAETASALVAIIDRNGDLGHIRRATGMIGLPVTCDVRPTFMGGATGMVAAVWLRSADAPAAGYGDSIVFDGLTWTVRPVFRGV